MNSTTDPAAVVDDGYPAQEVAVSDRDMLGDEAEGIDNTTNVDITDVVVSLQNDVATLQKQRRLDNNTFTRRIAALEVRVAELEHRLGDVLASTR